MHGGRLAVQLEKLEAQGAGPEQWSEKNDLQEQQQVPHAQDRSKASTQAQGQHGPQCQALLTCSR